MKLKLKTYNNTIYTHNSSLNVKSFDENIIVVLNFIKCEFLLIDEKDDKYVESLKIKYIQNTKKEIKYLYHIQIVDGGLVYVHHSYAKLTYVQHLLITLSKYIKILTNFENIFKLLTILFMIIPLFCNKEKYVNIYNNIHYDNHNVYDTLKMKDTTNVKNIINIKDTIQIKNIKAKK